MLRFGSLAFTLLALLAPAVPGAARDGFTVESSPQPEKHPPLSPLEGELVPVNPPSLVWRHDARAATYVVEFSRDASFSGEVIRSKPVPYPFYNHSAALDAGRWYWRYFVVAKDGSMSAPGPVRSFQVPAGVPRLPMPPADELVARMPAHPRIFVTPDTLAEFRSQREGRAREAWLSLKAQADSLLSARLPDPGKHVPIKEADIVHSQVSLSHTWKKGDPVRRQVFVLDAEGEAYWTPDYSYRDLAGHAGRADVLSAAYLISGDTRYAEAARRWIDHVAAFRLDYHLSPELRAEHDTVVYAYEHGLKAFALAYDRVHDQMTPDERRRAIQHVEFHADSAGRWIRDHANVHLDYQQSHVQQCMHTLMTTVLATAGESEIIDGWVRYTVPQYVNRIAWTSRDGGYFEGQTYGHKFGWILEGLAAIRTACGVDLFQRPEIRNAGTYWLYAMNLNYWFQHWGDNYSLIWPYANPRDSYISGFLAAMTGDPYVKWYADTVKTDPDSIPFRYLSDGSVSPRPPVDIAQAKAFPDTGVAVAYERFHDHKSDRVFFRSSPWGSHSHSHADQNSFVIHSGAEILAPDTGYYTYSGDTYHRQWSKSTFAHNSLLVNGKPQPLGIESKGRIASFFHGGKMTYVQGDASKAYAAPLETFRRALLFIRPGTYVVYDELQTSKPSSFSWLLNTFQEPEIEAEKKRITVTQQDRRLRVDHLLPAKIDYSANNKRPYPVKTPGKMWSRINEAFPQPWHIRAEHTATKNESAYLALLQTYAEQDGAREQPGETIDNATSVGLTFSNAKGGGTVLFRRHLGSTDTIRAGGITAIAESIALLGSSWSSGEWLMAQGSSFEAHGHVLWQSEHTVSASASFGTPAASAIVRISDRPGKVALSLPQTPSRLWLIEPHQPATAQPVEFTWDAERHRALFTLAQSGPTELWIDPVVDLRAELPAASLRVTDSSGDYELPLQSGWTENGEWIYFTTLTPRESGDYDFAGDTDFVVLAQDRWDLVNNTRAAAPARALLREGAEVYLTVKPGEKAPRFEARLARSTRGEIENLVRNGSFEQGIPNYPPRGWTFTLLRPTGLGWPEWSQADATDGKSALRFRRSVDDVTLTSQPMRLLSGGTYHLRFKSKGDAAGARLDVRGERGSVSVRIETSDTWREYSATVKIQPGYCLLSIHFPAGPDNEVLWIDDIRFGQIR